MISFIEQAQSYATYQQQAVTRYTHMAGIPLIILSLMILLGFVHVVIIGVLNVSVASIVTLALLIYYFRLHWRLALVLTPILIFLLWLASLLTDGGPTSYALWSFILIFIAGCALQFVGHFIEDKRPALIDNLWQVLIAPLFIAAEVFFMMGWMTELNGEIYGKEPVKKRSESH